MKKMSKNLILMSVLALAVPVLISAPVQAVEMASFNGKQIVKTKKIKEMEKNMGGRRVNRKDKRKNNAQLELGKEYDRVFSRQDNLKKENPQMSDADVLKMIDKEDDEQKKNERDKKIKIALGVGATALAAVGGAALMTTAAGGQIVSAVSKAASSAKSGAASAYNSAKTGMSNTYNKAKGQVAGSSTPKPGVANVADDVAEASKGKVSTQAASTGGSLYERVSQATAAKMGVKGQVAGSSTPKPGVANVADDVADAATGNVAAQAASTGGSLYERVSQATAAKMGVKGQVAGSSTTKPGVANVADDVADAATANVAAQAASTGGSMLGSIGQAAGTATSVLMAGSMLSNMVPKKPQEAPAPAPAQAPEEQATYQNEYEEQPQD